MAHPSDLFCVSFVLADIGLYIYIYICKYSSLNTLLYICTKSSSRLCVVLYILYISTWHQTSSWYQMDPSVHITLNWGYFYLVTSNKIAWTSGAHGPLFNPPKRVFYAMTCHVDCFYPSSPQFFSISLSPVHLYRITCTCIFYAFLGALCLVLF